MFVTSDDTVMNVVIADHAEDVQRARQVRGDPDQVQLPQIRDVVVSAKNVATICCAVVLNAKASFFHISFG